VRDKDYRSIGLSSSELLAVVRRRVGTAVVRQLRRAAGATRLATVVPSVNTKTGRRTTRSAATEQRLEDRRRCRPADARPRTPRHPLQELSRRNRRLRAVMPRRTRPRMTATDRPRRVQVELSCQPQNRPRNVKRRAKLSDALPQSVNKGILNFVFARRFTTGPLGPVSRPDVTRHDLLHEVSCSGDFLFFIVHYNAINV